MSFWRLLLKSLTYVHLLEKMRLVRFIIYLSLLCVEPVISQEINFTHSVQHSFIENKGQWKDHVLFQSKINGGNLWVEQGRFLFELQDFSELRAKMYSLFSVPHLAVGELGQL